jgi:hypothetical protein
MLFISMIQKYELTHQSRNRFFNCALFVFALSAGLVNALTTVGPRVLNPLDTSWMTGDPATAYLGWAFFRLEPHLRIPIGWSSAIGYPFGTPVAYFDSIPLIATMGWIIRDLLPQDFQYFGLYFFVCSALQFYFGFKVSRRVCGGRKLAGVLGGIFFLTAPPFVWRGFGHFALASHWLLLAAVDQLLSASEGLSWRRVGWSATLCFIAAAINPYVALMTLLVCSAAHVRSAMLGAGSATRCLAGIAVAFCSVALTLLLFGFIRGTALSQYTIGGIGGYDYYSMNLVSPIDPGHQGALLLAPQQIGPGQYEGYNYLGLGMLMLAVISVARNPASLARFFRRSSASALVVCVICVLLALSTKGTLGRYVLYDVRLPVPVMAVLSSFHCSGRFFWPAYYLIFTGIISATYLAVGGWLFYPLLVTGLVVQVIDLMPLRSAIYQEWQTASFPAMPMDASWHKLGERQKHLIVLPPWQCSLSGTPGGQMGYAIFERLALEQRMTINSFYAARYSDDERSFFCSQQNIQVESLGLQADTAYVFDRNGPASVASLETGKDFCRYVDDYILCSLVPDRVGIDQGILNDLVVLRPGNVIDFSGGGQISAKLLGFGWSTQEPWGRWIDGGSAELTFMVEANDDHDVKIKLSPMIFVSPGHARQRVEVVANGALVANETFQQTQNLDLIIPRHILGSNRLLRLRLICPDAVSPASIGLSADTRVLSLGVTQLKIEDAGRP